MIKFLGSPIKSLTSILRFVNLGYLIEFHLQKTAFVYNYGLIENFEGGR